MPAPNRDLLSQLLKDARITGDRMEAAVARAMNPDYWRALVSDCHVESPDSFIEFAPEAPQAIDDGIRDLHREGYFRLPGLVAPGSVRRLNAAIDAVTADGWPAAFAFVYDEPWLSARSAASSRVLESTLGPGFRQICHVWTHVVKPAAGSGGWSPHVDGDSSRCMSLWVALTPATLDNGCMHAVPSSVAEVSPDLVQRFRTPLSQFTRAEVVSLLHGAHALVAAPGDALGWGFDLIHWGGLARQNAGERRAFSFEFIAADQEFAEPGGELIDMDAMPSFEDRLRHVAANLLAFRKFEPIVDRFTGVAREIIKRLEPPG